MALLELQTVFAGDRHWRSLDDVWNGFLDLDECQCPLGLIPHFYTKKIEPKPVKTIPVSMPSRAYTSFLHHWVEKGVVYEEDYVSMPSRAYTSFLLNLSRAVTSAKSKVCQCPLGLIPHFYQDDAVRRSSSAYVSMPSRAYTSFLRNHTIQNRVTRNDCVNALSGLYLISTVPLQKPRFYAVSRACFCRYLSEYSDNSCFSCMLTFWTYLMRCTYP